MVGAGIKIKFGESNFKVIVATSVFKRRYLNKNPFT